MASSISRAVEQNGADLPRPRIFRFIDVAAAAAPGVFLFFAEACCLVASKAKQSKAKQSMPAKTWDREAFVCFVPFHDDAAAALARCCSATQREP
jgi:hypothetical protein